MTDIDTQADSPGIGDNRPPSALDEFKVNLSESIAVLAAKVRDQMVGLHKVPEVVDEGNASLVTDFLSQCKDVLADVKSLHTKLKKPHLERGKAVDEMLGPKSVLVTDCDKLVKAVTDRLNTFRIAQEKAEKERLAKIRKEEEAKAEAARAEAARIERETREAAERQEAAARAEADRLDREAREASQKAKSEQDRLDAAAKIEAAQEQKQRADDVAASVDLQVEQATAKLTEESEVAEATAKAAEREEKGGFKIKGDYGGTGFGTTRKVFKIIDEAAIPAFALWPYIDLPCKEKAIRAAIKGGATFIRGVEITDETKTTIRRG